ncbi:MAG: helix-turn-helix domain-containing protein [Nitrosopumilaceae archaeon]|nr:TrmB family transcriptional regulator [Nitrosopumilaceae archaeon]NIU00233.1 TrmB family transcriptional regulator [Nitrosopumilaceae archaeon]NIU86645.1 helix-turn-helix domain-containing protein [Nitrosopumilaceae archaeon]NIV65340.1 helix-turn-helix domain-containing protein [Nitrosopumilaceae archaeon]NIX60835.1 helix-turn-helix domain-containing protein [Nitrosopumilaceae archaeon]
MSISDKTRKALEKIGLTSYEIRTFSALLKAGELTASDLSQKSGVPYSKIYEVLGTLEEKGWIGSDDSRPTKYFPKSPSTGLDITKQRIDANFKDNQNVILNELVPLYEKSGTSERPDIWVLSGTMNIAAKILEMIESCRNEVMIALPEAGQDLVKQALPKLRLLHDKGVDIIILTSDKMDKDSLKSIARLAKVKVKKGLFGGGIISDQRYVVILLGPEIGKSQTSDIVAIWADHAGLAGFAREYFEYLLKDSRKVN